MDEKPFAQAPAQQWEVCSKALVTSASVCMPPGIALAAEERRAVSTSCAASCPACQRVSAFFLLSNDPGLLGCQGTVLFLCSAPGEFLRAWNQENTDLHINMNSEVVWNHRKMEPALSLSSWAQPGEDKLSIQVLPDGWRKEEQHYFAPRAGFPPPWLA